MNRKLPLLLILAALVIVATVIPAAADEPGETFARANQSYEAGNYSGALNLYLAGEKEIAHWKLFYNTGNCYYKLNNFVKAKIYYLRAERLKPFEPSIQKNIDIVNRRFSDKIEAAKPDFISRTALRIESFITLNVVSVVLLLAVAVLNAFIFILLIKGKNRFRLYGVSFSLIIVLLIGVYHIYRTGKQERRNTAVIVKADTQLRSGPGENNTVLFKVNPGLKVRIIEQSRQWMQVSASSQVAGWVPADRLEKI